MSHRRSRYTIVSPDELNRLFDNHPATEDCPDEECTICAMRDCPSGEPLHYHHDGCPSCDAPKARVKWQA